MKLSLLASTFLSAALLVSSACAQGPGGRNKTPLAQQMEGIARDFRSLRKQIKDPAQKESSLGLLKDMESHAAKAKELVPVKAKEIPESQRAQFVADYQKSIDGLNADFQKLETQIKDGKLDDAYATLDEVQNAKREGHKKFHAEDR